MKKGFWLKTATRVIQFWEFRRHETKLKAFKTHPCTPLFFHTTQNNTNTQMHEHLCTLILWSITTYSAKLRDMDDVAVVSDSVHTTWLGDFLCGAWLASFNMAKGKICPPQPNPAYLPNHALLCPTLFVFSRLPHFPCDWGDNH